MSGNAVGVEEVERRIKRESERFCSIYSISFRAVVGEKRILVYIFLKINEVSYVRF